jgi:outer membrane protein, heavy metal efflux system
MSGLRRIRWERLIGGAGIVLCAGCLDRQVELPCGYQPQPTAQVDSQTSTQLAVLPSNANRSQPAAPGPVDVSPKAPFGNTQPPTQDGKHPFELPAGLPGAEAPSLAPPRFPRDMPFAERYKILQSTYPALSALPSTEEQSSKVSLSLADVQRMALAASPAVQRAQCDVDAAYGAVIQAGLYPNPTMGWEADQWQPVANAGQQGGFINQLIKTAGKLSLARQVAGFDYLNAMLALRRAQIDLIYQVRQQYFSVIVARRSVEANRALVQMADEVYSIQMKMLAGGEAAGYEPLPLYGQAIQARNSLVQSEITYRAKWKQLTTLIGNSDLPPSALTGSAEAPAPDFDFAQAQAVMLEGHTDLLTARNTILQSQTNLTLQKKTRIPDLQTNWVIGHDNASGNNQFAVQLGVAVPLFDRNQGNIHQAQAKIGRSIADLHATEIDLQGRLTDAIGRYEMNRIQSENYRDRGLPAMSRAYRVLIRRYQQEPDKVGFSDIVNAQQNLAQALQSYLGNLDAQWQAAVDVVNLIQADDMYTPSSPVAKPQPTPTPPKSEKK